MTLVHKAPSERTQSGSFILMKFCLTQAITHSPSSDFCEVPAQRMLLMMSLKRLPGICSYELLPARLCLEREILLKWQKIQSVEVHQQSKYKDILVFCSFLFR